MTFQIYSELLIGFGVYFKIEMRYLKIHYNNLFATKKQKQKWVGNFCFKVFVHKTKENNYLCFKKFYTVHKLNTSLHIFLR